MQHLPLEIQTLYAELVERLVAFDASRAIGHLPGSFVVKTIKGQEYYYFQHSEPGGSKRQTYVGRRDDALERVVERYVVQREGLEPEVESIERLASLLRRGGAMVTDAASGRVLRGLADSGVFRMGGVLVGTHAFLVIGNVLGISWPSGAMRTQDLDIAVMSLALPNVAADIPDVLRSLEMGFLPVPGFDPAAPSTSYKVRGQSLRLDLLTPGSRDGGTTRLPRFNTAAQTLSMLDYLVESPIKAAAIDGGASLVSVPDPARFALHKLLVATKRPSSEHVKREKDLRQAAQILEVLVAERPGDVTLAWEAMADRGTGWTRRLERGLAALAKPAPEVTDGTRALITPSA